MAHGRLRHENFLTGLGQVLACVDSIKNLQQVEVHPQYILLQHVVDDNNELDSCIALRHYFCRDSKLSLIDIAATTCL